MSSLPYLRENTAKISKNKQKLVSKTVRQPTSGICLNLLHRRAHRVTMATSRRVREGRDLTNTAPPIRIQYS